ncbi:MAG: xanthine dehydrogenase family protein molybdopterin-binding subunit [Sphingomonadales bacterium]
MKKFGIGASIKRLEDDRFIKGGGQFTADINLENQIYGYMVRAPFAHAEIRSINIKDALEYDGVLDIILAGDLDENCKVIPCAAMVPGVDGSLPKGGGRPVLAENCVRHIGEGVAFVMASTYEAAMNAGDLIHVDYNILESVVDICDTIKDGAPQIYKDVPNNISLHWEFGEKNSLNKAFKKAKYVVSEKILNNRVIPNAMEPRAALASYSEDEGYILYVGSQGVWDFQDLISDVFLKVSKDRVRIVTKDVGGGFGMKGFFYAEYLLSLIGSEKLGRPVKWVASRLESFVSDTHGREVSSEVSLALNENGKFLGLKVKSLAGMGAYLSSFSPYIPTLAALQVLGGVYKFPELFVDVKTVFTNAPTIDAYRGAGRPEAAYMLELIINKAALTLGISQDDIRRINFIKESDLPYQNTSGSSFDSGDFEGTMEKAMAEASWESFKLRQNKSNESGLLRGIGMAYYIECTIGPESEEIGLNFTDDGMIEIIVGTQSNGQGHWTTFSQIASDHLGVPIEYFNLVEGDTARKNKGIGTGGSRSLQMVGNATIAACASVIDKGVELSAHFFEVDTCQVDFKDGLFKVKGSNQSIALIDLAKIPKSLSGLPKHLKNGLTHYETYTKSASTFPNGCHISEVEIDPETGQVYLKDYTVVDDLGLVINPMIVKGQVHGGIVQGLGQAWMENCVLEEGTGQLLTGSFMDYGMPRADDIPDINFSMNNIPCKTNPLGIKGCGEAGTIGALPSFVNACKDALKGMNIKHMDMPLTPEKIWKTLNF